MAKIGRGKFNYSQNSKDSKKRDKEKDVDDFEN